jgi:hypothetical protein
MLLRPSVGPGRSPLSGRPRRGRAKPKEKNVSATAWKKIAGASLLLLVVNATAFGQKTGMANRNAPTVAQTMTIGKETIELSYISITWAEGQWAKALGDEATKAAAKANINKVAESSPLGTFKTSVALTVGGQKVAAGTYKMRFTLDDKYNWQIVLAGDAASVTLPLELKSVEEDSHRLRVVLGAGEKDNTGEIGLAFGKYRGHLAVLPDAK